MISLCLALPAHAGPSGSEAPVAERHAQVALLGSTQQLVPGQVFTLGVKFSITPGWHIYWHGLNDTGYPIKVVWDLPEGWSAGDLLWPSPRRYVSPGSILDHVYEHEVTLLVPMTVTEDAAPGPVTLGATVSWLACREACIPEEAAVTWRGTVASSGQSEAGAEDVFSEVRELIPGPLPGHVRVELTPDSLDISAPGASAMEFYPYLDCLPFANLIADGSAQGPRLTLRRKPTQTPAAVSGVLKVVTEHGAEYYEVHQSP